MKNPVANTILTQLGGGRFLAMTGATNLLATNSGLIFQLPARLARDDINKVTITLTPLDLYTLTFYRMDFHTLNIQMVKEYREVTTLDLQHLFTEATGLGTGLDELGGLERLGDSPEGGS